MKNSLYKAFRHGLDILCLFMLSLTVILVYGHYPRGERYVPADEEMVAFIERYDEGFEQQEYVFGPESHPGFMDYLEEEDTLDGLDGVIEKLIEVENPQRDVDAVGDQHLSNKAYGLLQIRQPYLDDVNQIAGTDYDIEDMKDPELAKWAAKVYLGHYGGVYESRTGNVPTLEIYGRIHNGGPNGWRKASTNSYVEKIERISR